MGKIIEELSVFFPTYNEEGNIGIVVSRARAVLQKIAGKWEIIIVDDGSTDQTSKIADELAKNDKRVRVIHHKANLGYGGAFKTGFENAKYPWVAFTDSDGQFDFSDIEKLIAKKDDADLVLGFRKKRADSIARKVFTFGWASLARVILGLKAKDYSCGFKLIKKKVYEAVQPLVGEEKVTQIELLVKARKKKFRFAEVGVNHFPRTSGKQTGAKLRVVFKSVLDLFKLWGKIHGVSRRELISLLIILTIGAVLRLYKIDQYMTFLGDEGRDAIIVRRLLVEGHPPLIGPGTSIGQMYLGPLYYYLMAPALLLANFSPVGPAVQIAILGVITIAFVWWVGREWFSKSAGLIAAGLFAISPTVIIYARSSWNPNIMPFFALLSIYSIWKVWKGSEFKWLVVLGIAFAFTLQSHYLGLLLAPTIFLFWFITFKNLGLIENWKLKIGNFVKNSLLGYGLFLLLMSPLLLFDMRHGWLNSQAIYKFFTVRQETVSARPWNAALKIYPNLNDINTSLLTAKNKAAGEIVTLGLLLFTVTMIIRINIVKERKQLLLLFSWIGFGLIGFGLYKQQIYDHYYGFIFVVPFLLAGLSLSKITEKGKVGKLVALVIIGVLVWVNLSANPLRFSPNMQLARAINVAKKIEEESAGREFNLAVLAERNYEDGYQYFLVKDNFLVIDIDAQRPETITNQLFVVCELPSAKCDPTHSPKAEVANFGWSKIDGQWEVMGVTIYRLEHTK